jgi:hypothetical protein
MHSMPRLAAYTGLLASLLLLCGCALHPVQCQRDPPPQELSQDPPPEGTFLTCLKALEQGQTSDPACALLPQPQM